MQQSHGLAPIFTEDVPDWFVTHQQIRSWHDNDSYCNDDRFIEWYESYQIRKAQKGQIKEELMPIAWHPSRWWDCCVPEDETKETEQKKFDHLRW